MTPDQFASVKEKSISHFNEDDLRLLVAEVERVHKENVALRSQVTDLLEVCHSTWLKLIRCQDTLAAERGYGALVGSRCPVEKRQIP